MSLSVCRLLNDPQTKGQNPQTILYIPNQQHPRVVIGTLKFFRKKIVTLIRCHGRACKRDKTRKASPLANQKACRRGRRYSAYPVAEHGHKRYRLMKKAPRETQTLRARWLYIVRFGHRPPVANTQTHRQDRLQYTAPQLASAQCNY